MESQKLEIAVFFSLHNFSPIHVGWSDVPSRILLDSIYMTTTETLAIIVKPMVIVLIQKRFKMHQKAEFGLPRVSTELVRSIM